MGKMEDFESSLQVLRGFETDISAEVNEIKVTTSSRSNFVAVKSYATGHMYAFLTILCLMFHMTILFF
jgi:hypothetical protein